MSSELKSKLYKELELKNELIVEGIAFNPNIFNNLENAYSENSHVLCDYSPDYTSAKIPASLELPLGLTVLLKPDRKSPYKLERENDTFFITKDGNELSRVDFSQRPAYYDLRTSDGTPMKTIARYATHGVVAIAYSNECSLKETGKDCLFCNVNYTKDAYGDAEGIKWKYPNQIGETVAAAYKEGIGHLTITGGFIPERREVEYYLDVAEAIQDHTGLEDFNGTACIGAPHDLTTIDKYKEVGFRTLGINLEVWDWNLFAAYCPGKEQYCDGYDHWVKALVYAAKVFGHGRVRSNLVGGLESKKTVLEGLEFLASKGVIASANPWMPNKGSALEGHKSPVPEWHLDLAYANYNILRKNGFSYQQVYDANPIPITYVQDLYRIEDELFPVFQKENSVALG